MKAIVTAVVLLTAISATAQISVVVTARPADRVDAERLQAFTEQAMQRFTVQTPALVTVRYFGRANRMELPPFPPATLRGATNQLVFAAFTVTDRDGRVLDSEWIPDRPTRDQFKLLHDTADIIAKRAAFATGN